MKANQSCAVRFQAVRLPAQCCARCASVLVASQCTTVALNTSTLTGRHTSASVLSGTGVLLLPRRTAPQLPPQGRATPPTNNAFIRVCHAAAEAAGERTQVAATRRKTSIALDVGAGGAFKWNSVGTCSFLYEITSHSIVNLLNSAFKFEGVVN
jgi:hypothetical protein